jgi:hypothetical protein
MKFFVYSALFAHFSKDLICSFTYCVLGSARVALSSQDLAFAKCLLLIEEYLVICWGGYQLQVVQLILAMKRFETQADTHTDTTVVR